VNHSEFTFVNHSDRSPVHLREPYWLTFVNVPHVPVEGQPKSRTRMFPLHRYIPSGLATEPTLSRRISAFSPGRDGLICGFDRRNRSGRGGKSVSTKPPGMCACAVRTPSEAGSARATAGAWRDLL
jgi:hypothetical protein